MTVVCCTTNEILEGKAYEYHLRYHTREVNGEKVCWVIAMGSAGAETNDLQWITWHELKRKLPDSEAIDFPEKTGLWDYSFKTDSQWVTPKNLGLYLEKR